MTPVVGSTTAGPTRYSTAFEVGLDGRSVLGVDMVDHCAATSGSRTRQRGDTSLVHLRTPTVVAATHLDRGVRAGAAGAHHRDLGADDQFAGRAFLFVAPAAAPAIGVSVDHPAPLEPGGQLVIGAQAWELWVHGALVRTIAARDLPTDWQWAVRRRGLCTLVLAPDVPDLAAAANLAAALHPPAMWCEISVSVSSGHPRRADELTRNLKRHLRALNNSQMSSPPLTAEMWEPGPVTIDHLMRWGILAGFTGERTSTWWSSGDVLHAKSRCGGRDAESTELDLDVVLSSSLCATCAPQRHGVPDGNTAFGYDAGKWMQEAAKSLQLLRGTAANALTTWDRMDAAAVAAMQVINNHQYGSNANQALLAGVCAGAVLAEVDQAASRLRRQPGIAVERAVLLAADAQLRSQLGAHLDTLAPGLGAAAIDLCGRGANPVEHLRELAATYPMADPAAVAVELAGAIDWLDSQCGQWMGPLHLVFAPGAILPAEALWRLVGWRWGMAWNPASNAHLLVAPTRVVEVLLATGHDRLANVGPLSPNEDLGLLLPVLDALPTTHSVAIGKQLTQLRQLLGVDVIGVPVGYDDPTQEPLR